MATEKAGRLMLVLGLDPATRCGWALRRPDGSFDSGVWDLTPRKEEGPGSRYLKLSCHLVELAATHEIGAVYYEQVMHHAGAHAGHIYGALVGFIQAFAEKRGIRHRPVPWACVKKYATTNAVATKASMLEAAQARWPGWEFEDDNEADARFIAEVGFHGVPARTSPKRKTRRSA